MCTEARNDYERVLALNEEVGSTESSIVAASNLGVVYVEQGDVDSAEIFIRRALGPGMPDLRPFAAGNLALLYYRRGDYNTVRKYIEIMENDPTRDFQKWIPRQALVFRGLCSVGEQDWETAVQIHRELASLEEVDALPMDLSTVHEFIGQVIAVGDGAAKAESYLLEKSAKAIKFDYLAGARLALLATSYFECGQHDRIESIATPILDRATKFGAIAVARQATRVLESLGAPWHRGRAKQPIPQARATHAC
jgi:tetratricopeptide (TPR) repeat protein